MRILHCIPSMLGGGAERQLCYLSTGLTQMGHEVHVALMREGPNIARLRSSGAIVHLLRERSRYDVAVLAELCALVYRTRADVVQTWLARMDMWGGLAANAMGKPWVYSERNVWPMDESWLDALRRKIIGRSSVVVANSNVGADFWRSTLLGTVPVRVIDNALPMDELTCAPRATLASLGIAEGSEVVLYTGRFIANKNIGLLAEVLVSVLRARPKAVAVCCGEGIMVDGLIDTLRRAGVGGRCVMFGYRPDVWSIMKCADVTLSTSDREGRPNALLEAMACGCPIVASDIPQHREIIASDAGLFFRAGSVAEGAAAVHAVLDDHEAAAARAARAVKSVTETMSPRAAAEAYTDVYRSLVRRG